MASSETLPPWSETPGEILGLVIDRLASASAGADHRTSRRFSAVWSKLLRVFPFAAARDYHRGFQAVGRARQSALLADCARFRAVCRSWCSAMRQHMAPPLLPWIIISDGSFFAPSDDFTLSNDGSVRSCRRLTTFPENAICIGFTDDWLALDCTDPKNMHNYFLHNPFSGTTVPLPELTDIIGNVSQLFEVRKVLMRSTPRDVVAILTNNWNYPIILVRPGKGVWLPEPQATPFIYIIDIAFIGDKLYGITQAEDLISLGVNFDSDGTPNITSIERVIKHQPGYYRFDVWRDVADENFEATSNDVGEYGFEYSNEAQTKEEYEEDSALDELREKTGDDMILEGITYLKDTNGLPYEPKDTIAVIRYLVESRGKLFIVRRLLQFPLDMDRMEYTRKVEIFESCASTASWVPVSHGLGGQALFISKLFCKSISAYGDIESDTIYFVDTGEMFNVKSQTISTPRRDINHRQSMWMFSPGLVV